MSTESASGKSFFDPSRDRQGAGAGEKPAAFRAPPLPDGRGSEKETFQIRPEKREARAAPSQNAAVRNFIETLRGRLALAQHSEGGRNSTAPEAAHPTEPEALARTAEPRAQRCGEAGLGDPVRQVEPDDDLTTRFRQSATAAGFHVHAATPADWGNVIHEILKTHAARSIRLGAPEPPVLSEARCAALIAGLEKNGIRVLRGGDDETLFSVDAALTGVSAVIAETGTIVCESGAGRARGASLIPPVHIALVAASQIIADLCDFFEACGRRAALPANVNLITGPSKTADVEGVLVTGVHGPGHVHVVVLEG